MLITEFPGTEHPEQPSHHYCIHIHDNRANGLKIRLENKYNISKIVFFTKWIFQNPEIPSFLTSLTEGAYTKKEVVTQKKALPHKIMAFLALCRAKAVLACSELSS